mmetsp:Transcript_17903/g.29412  ORF Transcript_17903/g.29412 Transcript_17903/m.29412 type:complete len:563 (-) Transcript_17903:327-2015(-)
MATEVELDYSSRSGRRAAVFSPIGASTASAVAKSSSPFQNICSSDRSLTPVENDVTDLLDYLQTTAWNNKANSDITLEVLGDTYCLHKVLIERCPFFKSMFSERWNQSEENRVSMKLNAKDYPGITRKSVRQALQSLYGYSASLESVKDAVDLLASAQYFGLERLQFQSERYLLDNVCLESVHLLYQFFHSVCIGACGESILAACRSLLLRKGYQNPEVIALLPRDVIKEILMSSALCVPGGEQERFRMVETVFDSLRAHRSAQAALSNPISAYSELLRDAPRDFDPTADLKCERILTPKATDSPTVADEEDILDTDNSIDWLWGEVINSIHFSAFPMRDLMKVKERFDCRHIDECMWKRMQSHGFISKQLDPADVAALESFRHCVVFQDTKLQVECPHDVFSDGFIAFGSLWQAKIRLQLNPKDKDRRTISCHLHRQNVSAANSIPLAASLSSSFSALSSRGPPDLVDMELMRKFKFSICIPIPGGQIVQREGVAEFALKGDARLTQSDANKYGWGWDSVLDFADLREILTDGKLFIITTVCPLVVLKDVASATTTTAMST